MLDPDHQWTLDVRGMSLRVHEWRGPVDTRPPVICLHGWLDHGLAFAPVAAGRPGRWLALDQRGFGQSDACGPGGYPHFLSYVADVSALIASLGGGPVDLVGHSMGGTVASLVAAALPSRVRRLVVVEGLGALPRWTMDPVGQLRTHLEGLEKLPRVPVLAHLDAAIDRLRTRHPRLSAEHARLLAEGGTRLRPDGRRVWSYDPLHMTRAAYPFDAATYARFLAAIEAPTLVAWATESWYPAEIRQERAGQIPGSTVATIEGGHMLPYDNPGGLGDLLEDWLCRS